MPCVSSTRGPSCCAYPAYETPAGRRYADVRGAAQQRGVLALPHISDGTQQQRSAGAWHAPGGAPNGLARTLRLTERAAYLIAKAYMRFAQGLAWRRGLRRNYDVRERLRGLWQTSLRSGRGPPQCEQLRRTLTRGTLRRSALGHKPERTGKQPGSAAAPQTIGTARLRVKTSASGILKQHACHEIRLGIWLSDISSVGGGQEDGCLKVSGKNLYSSERDARWLRLHHPCPGPILFRRVRTTSMPKEPTTEDMI